MKRLLLLLVACAGVASGRSVVSFDSDWRFLKGDAPGAERADFDAGAWQVLDLPHDWSIGGEFREDAPTGGAGGWLPSGVGCYRKAFEVPADWSDQRVWVEFDGVMANSEVWINGHSLGVRPSGYFSFRHELSEYLNREGTNLICVRADTREQPASRWYTGAGIYRHVRLIAAPKLHFAFDGIFIVTPHVSHDRALVEVRAEIVGACDKEVAVRHRILGPDGKDLVGMVGKAGGNREVLAKCEVPAPPLWSVDHPQLCRVVSELLVAGEVRDEVTTAFGIRSAKFQASTGFWLNGRNLKLKGVCLHHDGGAVGAAVPLRVWERRLEMLKELGVNAIRTAHNPVDPGFLTLCDAMGFLVMDEAFDCWTKSKNPHDYHKYFKEWWERDLRAMVRRDRNHPSVVLYSVGNEIRDTHDTSHAKEVLKGLVEVCHENDPTRPVTQALFRPNSTGDYDNGLADLLDVVGTNYRDAELLEAWDDKPERKIIGTEQGHERSTWFRCRDNPQHAGQFLWVGIDYLGESRRWPVTTFNSGLLDRTGHMHPRGAERQSWWSDQPVLHIYRRVAATEETPADPGYEAVEWKRRQVLFPDWTPRAGDPGEQHVEIYTNAEEVELQLNGNSLGSKQVKKDYAVSWKVPFAAGVMTAIAREDGKEIIRRELKTASQVERLVLTPDRTSIRNEFEDVSHIEVRVVDRNGTLVPDAKVLVRFSIEGPGQIVAVDSGSITSLEGFQREERTSFQGRCLAIVRATADQGPITVSAAADGLESATVTLSPRVAE